MPTWNQIPDTMCSRFYQGCQRSVWFEFPDFPWHTGGIFPWPHDTDPKISHEILSQTRKNFVPATIRFLQKDAYKWGRKFGSPKSDHFPWLSTKNIEIHWLSRRKTCSLILPDTGNPVLWFNSLKKFHSINSSWMFSKCYTKHKHLSYLGLRTMPKILINFNVSSRL